MPAEPGAGSETFERRVATKLAAAGCRLRHDKVALRLIAGVKAGISQTLPPGESIIFAIAAPIKHPAKTIAALSHLLPNMPAEGLHTTVHGNEVHARRVRRGSIDMPEVMGFVHNPERDAGFILDLAESSLRQH